MFARIIKVIDNYVARQRKYDIKFPFIGTINTRHKGEVIERAENYKTFLAHLKDDQKQLVQTIVCDIENLGQGRLGTSMELREELLYVLFELHGKDATEVTQIKKDLSAGYTAYAAISATPMGYYGKTFSRADVLEGLTIKLKKLLKNNHYSFSATQIEGCEMAVNYSYQY